jgi:myo-inositol-1(or 4)-monophosphatase
VTAPAVPSHAEWLVICRRAADAARQAVARYATTAERAVETGRGEGGDTTLAIDRAAEDAVIAELEAHRVDVTAVSEERGEVIVGGGGPTRVVIDPVDGSLNAKRGLPFACVSIAVASGGAMQDVDVGVVAELDPRRDWWALRGGGAWRDGERLPPLEPGPLEMLGLETARPRAVAGAAGMIATMEARRVRALGSVALSLCLVAAGRLDAMLSLRAVRSVDAAAGQLLVREAGGAVSFPDAGERISLGLDMRSRVVAARDPRLLARLLGAFEPAR